MACIVSVIMSVFNRPWGIKETVNSVLNQSFSDFEFIIVDDGSSEPTAQLLDEIAGRDPRIKLLRNQANVGLTRSLNRALEIARGEFVARIDAGSTWAAHKLEKQLVA